MEFEEVVEKYADMVLRIAYQHTLNKDDSEDIMQEVFIKLVNYINTFESNEHMKAWIIRVTINLCKNHTKTSWKKKVTSFEYDIETKNEEPEFLLEELSKLKPIYRDTIYLYYYEGYKIFEIAEILNMKKNTVNSNLVRARKKLKKTIIESGDDYE